MNRSLLRASRGILVPGIFALLAAASGAPSKDTTMSHTARGAFDVKVGQLADRPFDGGTRLGRYSLDKVYHGELKGSATGEMLTATTAVEGSGVYVAVEHVAGTLDGRTGTFALQHAGSMAGGAQRLAITVVPDSGTGELTGLEGRLTVRIEKDGSHFYELEYTLPPTSR